MPIRCFVIGGNSLTIACGDVLLEVGAELCGVVTSSTQVADWASRRKLQLIDAGQDFVEVLRQKQFDYLFSIAHLRLIPETAIELPLRGAINFHDGLLPDYAGLNVPVWTLLNGESKHGITWHLMTGQADAGDILKQEQFPISADDTAFRLNTKCFDAGIRSFRELLLQLRDDRTNRIQQDFTNRKYFSRFRRPAAACVINWRSPVEEIDRLVRALDFGGYANPIGSPTFFAAKKAYVITEVEILNEPHDACPGSIIAVYPGRIQIAAGGGIVELKSLARFDGRPINMDEVVTRHGLQAGQLLDSLNSEQRDRLSRLAPQIAKAEEFWTGRLSQVAGFESLAPESNIDIGHESLAHHEFIVPIEFLRRFGDRALTDGIPAALVAFLARSGNLSRVSLAVEDENTESDCDQFDALFSRRLPVTVRTDLEQGLQSILDAWTYERKVQSGHNVWLRDLIGRSPELRGKPELEDGNLRLFGVKFVDELPNTCIGRNLETPLLVVPRRSERCRLESASQSFGAEDARLFCERFCDFLVQVAVDVNRPLIQLPTLTTAERQLVIHEWNNTDTQFARDACMHQFFERQAERTPEADAIVCRGRTLTYLELNERANRLAAYLQGLGVGPDDLVGVCVERSLEMIVAVLGVLKAGGAYVPLDPTFPANRISFMMDDSRAKFVITQAHLLPTLPTSMATIVRIDADWPAVSECSADNPNSGVSSGNLAYMIYTSGSTGRPKGVMIEHRNVANFFAGMDDRIECDPVRGQVWLGVTSLSFDISVLELFWTLARGFKIVLYSERFRPRTVVDETAVATPMRFSLFYFSSDESERSSDKYRLLLEGARFADQNGFVAVSTPERHFHAFGGLYPNPAVSGAAIAAITRRVQIRAGSVVLPLHHPARVAEEWSLVDNLSNGRVGISFASGWQPVDFVLRPEAYADRHRILYDGIETVRRLWHGEAVEFVDQGGNSQAIRTLPRPIQKELPIWVTTAGSPDTWRRAGEIGANILTHLLGQTLDEVREKAGLYRDAYRRAGHPGVGYVTLMLHTFIGDDVDAVRETVRQPMKDYIGSSLSLVKNVASAWSAYKRRADGSVAESGVDLSSLSAEEMDGLLDFSFERYFETSGLFGTPGSCVEFVRRLRGIGVDEIACLIDFGVNTDTTLAHLDHLNRLRMNVEQDSAVILPDAMPATGDETIGALIRRHAVTHLQCTPSMASLILADDEARQSLRSLQVLMVGGEALPLALARELRAHTGATILNMYGPTETTIWSSTANVRGDESLITIGRPIANTQLYILDNYLQPVPIGAVGELYIGGEGVVRGYHERPELTADRFRKNPFVNDSSAKIYRTGDLARYRSDGDVEFLGRVDHQVKIRGYRIELGEIEAAISEHPEIREVVVIAREDSPGDNRLVAYFVSRLDKSIEESELRARLRDRLPEYMVPSRFIAMKSLPQTPNKKVDRRALPAPSNAAAGAETISRAMPANEVESKIVGIWQELLGLSYVGREDNFFDIGGHSLLAIQAHRRLKESFEREFAVTDLFQFPTVSSLAAFINADTSHNRLDEVQQRGASRREMMMQRRNARL